MDSLKIIKIVFFSLIICACGSQKKSVSEADSPIEFTENNEDTPIEVLKPCKQAEEQIRLETEGQRAMISNISQQGECFLIQYQYSGCNAGRTHLAVTEKIQGKKSLHLKVEMLIEGAGECDMLLEASGYFTASNIAPNQDYSIEFVGTDRVLEFKQGE